MVQYDHESFGVEYPFEILMGNHEDERKQNGYIGNFVQYCPDQLSSVGRYGAEYYFDYPQSNPLVRVIMIGANNSWDYDGDGVVSEWEKFNYTKIIQVTYSTTIGCQIKLMLPEQSRSLGCGGYA